MIGASAALLSLALVQAAPVFRAGVELVYVDVSVTKKGDPLPGLSADEFIVTDNGVRQRVTLVDRESTPTTAVLALDASRSVTGEKLASLRAAAMAFVRGMNERDEAALLTFNQSVELRQPPTTDKGIVADALARVDPKGSTSVIDALYLCLKRRWGGGRPLIVLFTDGEDNASWLENEAVLEAARETSAVLYVIGTQPAGGKFESARLDPGSSSVLTDPGHMYLLQRAADITGGAYWSATFTRLEQVFLRVLAASSARYLLSFEPEGTPRVGRHRLKVSVRRRGVEVRARQEYVVRAPAPR